jgi:prevent-host-death family protein
VASPLCFFLPVALQYWRTMKTATVRELRNRYSELLKWIAAGEEILITRRGIGIARLVPLKPDTETRVDWARSAAFRLDRRGMRSLNAKESRDLLAESQGNF